MRIYVDELPKSCSWCPCFNSSNNTCKIDDSDVDCIPVDSYRVRFFNYTDKRHPICPLQSLSDYTKQVRKEVLSALMNMLGDRAELIDCGGVAEFMFTTYDLSMCIEEILGEGENK